MFEMIVMVKLVVERVYALMLVPVMYRLTGMVGWVNVDEQQNDKYLSVIVLLYDNVL